MDLKLNGRRALITASTGGLGLEMARALAAEGAHVFVNGRTRNSADRAVADILATHPDAVVAAVAGDCGTAEGCRAVIEALPEVDVLVNNLGIYEAVALLDSADDDWMRLYEINVLSGVRLTRHYLPSMLARSVGRVINIASEAALTPAPELPHYSATKTAQLSVSRMFAELTKGSGVTVNAVLPGSSKTVGVANFVQDLFPELGYPEAEKRFMDENRSTSLLGRLIDPTEIASVVTFIASDLSGAINGVALRADGGIVRTVF